MISKEDSRMKKEAIEKIAEMLFNDTSCDYLGRARTIIATLESLGYVQLDENQSLPKIGTEQCNVNLALNMCPLLNAGFRKVKK